MSNANSSNGKEKSKYGRASTALSPTSNKVFIKDDEWRCSGCLEVTKQENLRKPVKVATDSILKLPPKPGQSCHFGGA